MEGGTTTTTNPSGADATISGSAKDDRLGYVSATSLVSNDAGDIDGDGDRDMVLQAPLALSKKGEAYLFYGSIPTGSYKSMAADTMLSGDTSHRNFSIGLTGAGDINGDGYDDLAVGASVYSSSITDDGVVFLYYGNSSWSWSLGVSDADAVFEGEGGGHTGHSLSRAGDMNGDALDDLFIGAHDSSVYATNGGAAYLVFGDTTAWTGRVDLGTVSNVSRLYGNTSDYLGISASSAGDYDGDGSMDLLVGAHNYDYMSNEGGVFVLLGGSY